MEFFTLDIMMSLMTLTLLEVILGIDNVIFISVLVEKLEKKERTRTRTLGIGLALIIRVLMLFGATQIMKLTEPLFSIFGFGVSGKSLLLILGGGFLVFKGIHEIKEMFKESTKEDSKEISAKDKYFKIVSQIIFIDIILSFDSIITAVGISSNFPVMVIAIIIAMIVMLISAEPIGKFIYENPSIKILALAFIGFLGMILVLAGIDVEISKGYLYFSMLFSLVVETINVKLKKKA